jgi:hypothetical protein
MGEMFSPGRDTPPSFIKTNQGSRFAMKDTLIDSNDIVELSTLALEELSGGILIRPLPPFPGPVNICKWFPTVCKITTPRVPPIPGPWPILFKQ